MRQNYDNPIQPTETEEQLNSFDILKRYIQSEFFPDLKNNFVLNKIRQEGERLEDANGKSLPANDIWPLFLLSICWAGIVRVGAWC